MKRPKTRIILLQLKRQNKMRKKLLILIILSFLFTVTLQASFSFSHPILPTEFYGKITTYNVPATSGTVKAYVNNTLCGSFSIINGGYYGVLSCMGDDPETAESEGAIDGDTITLKYNTDSVTVFGNVIFESGEFKLVNITHPVLFCGDGFCDVLENCNTCSTDCFTCNATSNQTTNSSNNSSGNGSSGGSSGGSGGGGGGGGSGGSGSSGGSSSGGTQSTTGSLACAEDWNCIEWTECTILGLQTRKCTDSNSCSTYNNKPIEVQECSYSGNCFDNIMNCHDGLCEQGIDCGGSCLNKCSIFNQQFQNTTLILPQLEIPMKVCERKIDIKNKGLWIFVLVIILAIVLRYLYSRYYIKKVQKNESLTPLNRARKVLSSKRKNMLFCVTLSILAIMSFLYSYYFLLCPNIFFGYSWILLLLLILVPLVIHTIMKRFEYDESLSVEKQKKLEDEHYQNVLSMIQLENDILAEEENAIASKLYAISNKSEFKEILAKHNNIKSIYKELIDLYSKYKERKNPFNIEKDLCDDIDALDKDNNFREDISKIPELKELFEKLLWLYKQYEEKQKLYDQLDNIDSKTDSK